LDNLKFLNGFSAIHFQIHLDSPLIKSDRFLLKVVLSNQISNAVKFQKREEGVTPEIKIRSFINDHLVIEEEDNGEGIENIYQDRIFEIFYRASTNSSGSGWGCS